MKWTKQKVNNLFFFLGVATVVVMLLTFDVSFIELWHHLCKAGYWLIPIVGIWFFIYGLDALAWLCVIRGNVPDDITSPSSLHSPLIPSADASPTRSLSSFLFPLSSKFFWRIFRLTITGYALNYATPVGGLGGEPYRIMELSKDIGNQRAASSVILYAMMHIFAHFWLWFSTVFLYLALAAVGDLPFTSATAVVLGIITVFCLIAFYLFSKGYRHGLTFKVIRLIGKIPGLKGWSTRFLERHSEALHNIDHQIAALHQQDKRAFYSSLLLEYLSRIVQSMEIMFMLLLFGIDCGGGWTGLTLTFLHSILILSFTTLLANLIGFLPMQLGVQEGGFVISIAAMGLSAALGLFVSIICRVREIIWIVIGLILMKIKE